MVSLVHVPVTGSLASVKKLEQGRSVPQQKRLHLQEEGEGGMFSRQRYQYLLYEKLRR